MASEPRPPSLGSALAVRILVGAVVLFVVLTVIGWIVGALVAVVRTLVILGAVLAIGYVVLVGGRR